ncbi:MAG: CAP domain-containing protein [Actinomycetota bacterium]
MPRRSRIARIIAVVTLCLVLGSSVQAGGSCYRHSKKDRLLAKKTNAARANAGVRKLRLDPHLARVARRQARAMAKRRTLYHTPNLGSKVTRWRTLGENVGYATSIKRVHRAFMNSSSHRSNILRSGYRFVGAGVRKAGGYVWVAVVFESRRNPGTTLKMPSC